jgi:hypothetical protein
MGGLRWGSGASTVRKPSGFGGGAGWEEEKKTSNWWSFQPLNRWSEMTTLGSTTRTKKIEREIER